MSIEFSKIEGLDRLGKGAVGTVFKVPGGALSPNIPQPLALKKYKKAILDGHETAIGEYLQTLIKRRADAPKDVRAILDAHTTWPMALVLDNGHPCGFLMNLIPDQYFITFVDDLGEDIITANFDAILDTDEHRQKMGLAVLNGTGRAKITLDLLRVVSALHKSQIVIGDISPNNILVHVEPSNQALSKVLVIDADSFRVMTQVNPLKQQHTGGWQPPEAMAAEALQRDLRANGGDRFEISRLNSQITTQNTRTDVYKIALAVTRLYHTGERRSLIRSSDSAQQRLERSFGKHFADLISRGLSDTPSSRPTAEELFTGFNAALRRSK